MARRIGSILALVSAFALGCFASLHAPDVSVPDARAADGRPRWEYKCLAYRWGGLDIDRANALGAEGWELAAASPEQFCFKRSN